MITTYNKINVSTKQSKYLNIRFNNNNERISSCLKRVKIIVQKRTLGFNKKLVWLGKMGIHRCGFKDIIFHAIII